MDLLEEKLKKKDRLLEEEMGTRERLEKEVKQNTYICMIEIITRIRILSTIALRLAMVNQVS